MRTWNINGCIIDEIIPRYGLPSFHVFKYGIFVYSVEPVDDDHHRHLIYDLDQGLSTILTEPYAKGFTKYL